MNYEKIYRDFIVSRREREVSIAGYSEKHHIRPKALGGGNEKSNLIRLTPEDHIHAHILLARIYGGSMLAALFRMRMGKGKKSHVVSKKELREMAFAKKMHGLSIRGKNHPMWGVPCSELSKQKTRERHAAGFNPMFTQEARDKVSAALKGRVRTKEHSEKISVSKRGVKDSDATRLKKKIAHTGLKQSAAHNTAISRSLTGRKKKPEHVAKMVIAITGRKLSAEHAEKARNILNQYRGAMRGKQHSDDTKRRMSKVNQAKKVYSSRFGVSSKNVSLQMMRAVGIVI